MDPGGECRADGVAVPCLAPCFCSCARFSRVCACASLCDMLAPVLCVGVRETRTVSSYAWACLLLCVLCVVCVVHCVFLSATLSSYTPRNLNSNTTATRGCSSCG